MGPKRASSAKKGKQPAKRRAPARPAPVISSSDDEDLPDLRPAYDKLSAWEQGRLRERGMADSFGTRRTARLSKAQKIAEIHRMTGLMLSRLSVLEGGRPSSSNQQQPMDLTSGRQSTMSHGVGEAEISETPGPSTGCHSTFHTSDQVLDLSSSGRDDGRLSQAVPLRMADGAVSIVGPGGKGGEGGPARGGVESWRAEAFRAVGLALAPVTRRTYAAACMDYQRFCARQGLGPWPASADQLTHYAVHLHRKGLSPRTIQGQSGSQRLRVVICGHSYIFWAARYARSSAWGTHLGLGDRIQVDWRGRRGMSWDVFSAVASRCAAEAPIAILLVHLGGNDMTRAKGKDLILRIIRDLKAFKALFPYTHVVWSAMLPRLVWHGAHNPMKVDRARRCLNREISIAMRQSLGSVITHPEIKFSRPDLFRTDGVHLNDAGLDILLNDFRMGLCAVLDGLVAGKEHA